MRRLNRLCFALCVSLSFATVGMPNPGSADEIDNHLQTISRVGPQGAGSAEARRARDKLASSSVDILPRLLQAMDTSNVVAANWYRTVYEEIVTRELAKSKPKLPIAGLKEFVRNPESQGRARRLVLKLLEELDPTFRDRLIPMLLDDPEFRSEAVELALKSGDSAKKAGDVELAKAEFHKAFQHSRDGGQVVTAANRLKGVGVDVRIVDHMGFLTDWYLLGPFDAPETSGFRLEFPPEKQVDLKAVYAGKNGAEIRWKRFETSDRMGQLNLIQAIAPVKEAVGYAYTEVTSPKDQPVELRCGADDNLSVWLNGEKIFARLQWLNGTRLDRFTAPARLKKGTNRVLVKICQGPQHKNPAVPNNWSLQLRFCDESGAAVGLNSALPTIDKK